MQCQKVNFENLEILHLCTFAAELSNFQHAILDGQNSIYLIDCFIKLNPNFNENEEEERTIEEMQETLFDQ